jgi:hypothetical protein
MARQSDVTNSTPNQTSIKKRSIEPVFSLQLTESKIL